MKKKKKQKFTTAELLTKVYTRDILTEDMENKLADVQKIISETTEEDVERRSDLKKQLDIYIEEFIAEILALQDKVKFEKHYTAEDIKEEIVGFIFFKNLEHSVLKNQLKNN